MNITQILFWFLSVMAIFSAVMMVVSKNVVYSILFLIATFFSISGHYLLLNAQFLFIVNIIVYAGAIMVLFLFVVMFMNLNPDDAIQKSNKYMLLAGTVSGLSLMLILIAALKKSEQVNQLTQLKTGGAGLIKNLGNVLFTDYVFPFEIASVLFLSAMIGAVIISKKEKNIQL